MNLIKPKDRGRHSTASHDISVCFDGSNFFLNIDKRSVNLWKVGEPHKVMRYSERLLEDV